MKFYYAVPLVLLLAGSCAARQLTSANDTGKIIRLDPAFDALVPKDARIEKVAGGFAFTEGPVWRPEGVLWFSDVPGNLVRSVTPAGLVKVLIENAGGTPVNPRRGAFVGPNGMISDKDGAVLLCQHTNRQIVRVTKDLKMTPYIDKFEGHRPNDLVYRSDGSLYFTRPSLRPHERGHRPGQGTGLRWRLPIQRRPVEGHRQGSQPSQRPRVLARSENPVRCELR